VINGEVRRPAHRRRRSRCSTRVGFAIEDFSALKYVYQRALKAGHFQQLDMIADPDDPRDLFGMLTRATEPA
jgi:ornithine cyclodeaminase